MLPLQEKNLRLRRKVYSCKRQMGSKNRLSGSIICVCKHSVMLFGCYKKEETFLTLKICSYTYHFMTEEKEVKNILPNVWI
jgi:hypothetical protein